MIHSSYIVDDVIAMQRPSDEHFVNNRFVEQLKERNVVAVFNLQEPGEHPFCGFGINASGFSYYPEKLMQAGSKLRMLLRETLQIT
jgi:protein tyrosine phosphatase domain-containing protein 1